jgi:hypothetical protein
MKSYVFYCCTRLILLTWHQGVVAIEIHQLQCEADF